MAGPRRRGGRETPWTGLEFSGWRGYGENRARFIATYLYHLAFMLSIVPFHVVSSLAEFHNLMKPTEYRVPWILLMYCYIVAWIYILGTCEASRFEFESAVPIRLESDGPIQKFWNLLCLPIARRSQSINQSIYTAQRHNVSNAL